MKNNPYRKIRSKPMFSLSIENMTDYYPVNLPDRSMSKELSPGMLDELFNKDDRKFQKGVNENFDRNILELERKMMEQDLRELQDGGDRETLRGEVPDVGGGSLNPQSLPPGYFKRKK